MSEWITWNGGECPTTEQRIDRLERELAELRYERGEGPKPVPNNLEPEKWEPEGGRFFVEADGSIQDYKSWPEYKTFGTERPTRELAEKARDAMRVHNRALAYVHEHAPDWDGSSPYAVWYDGNNRAYRTIDADHPDIGVVVGPEWVMQKLADDLNSGRVEL